MTIDDVARVANTEARLRLLDRLASARRDTDGLFERIDPQALYDRPIAERHRFIFYIGHLEAFDWNLLAAPTRGACDPALDRLFAFGIDPVGTALPCDSPQDWPTLDKVMAYRRQVRRVVDELARTVDVTHAAPWQAPDGLPFGGGCLLNVAIEHRLMHAETLSYMCHRLAVGALRPGPDQPTAGQPRAPGAPRSATREWPSHPRHAPMAHVSAGPVTLGLSRHHAALFGWDNEYPERSFEVPAFAIDRHMVTNGQYLTFMHEGGYDDASYWKPADWSWRCANDIRQPGFWRHDGDRWLLRAMFEELPLPLDWPVYVSHAEASAYARWAGKALPTEAQWMRAASGVDLRMLDIGPRFQECVGVGAREDTDLRWDPEPVEAAGACSSFGVSGLFGNGWQWTSTTFGPSKGFEALPFYKGYSQDFFDDQHFVLKGGSPRTAACMLRPSFRNWFQPHYQHVHAGFRCVIAPR